MYTIFDDLDLRELVLVSKMARNRGLRGQNHIILVDQRDKGGCHVETLLQLEFEKAIDTRTEVEVGVLLRGAGYTSITLQVQSVHQTIIRECSADGETAHRQCADVTGNHTHK